MVVCSQLFINREKKRKQYLVRVGSWKKEKGELKEHKKAATKKNLPNSKTKGGVQSETVVPKPKELSHNQYQRDRAANNHNRP